MSGNTLQCVECGAESTFSAKEQKRLAAGGYTNEPECYFTSGLVETSRSTVVYAAPNN